MLALIVLALLQAKEVHYAELAVLKGQCDSPKTCSSVMRGQMSCTAPCQMLAAAQQVVGQRGRTQGEAREEPG